VSETKRLRALEDENGRLKRMLAETMLDNAALKDLAGKKVVTPGARREAALYLRQAYEMRERRACRVIGTDRTSVRYQGVRPADDALRERLKALAGATAVRLSPPACCCGARVVPSTRSGSSASTAKRG
jgi:putative transposase